MTLPRPDIARLARLARLQLSPEEARTIETELSSIVDHLAFLQSIGGSPGVEPGTAGAPLRPDLADPEPLRLPLAELAPDWLDGYFRVPRPPGVRSVGGE